MIFDEKKYANRTQSVTLPNTNLWLLGFLLFGSLLLIAAAPLPPRPDTAGTPPTTAITTQQAISAQILLQAAQFEADDWTVVQWQGVDEQWHDVTGWQGNFLQSGKVIWWVAESQLGQTNFRWLVYDNQSRTELLLTSSTFDLPAKSNESVLVSFE